MTRRLILIAALAVLAVIAAACGGDDEPTAAPTATSAPQPTATTAPGQTPAPTATPAPVEVDLSGRTIVTVATYSPGGGYDATARLVSAHLGRFLPGEPRFIVQNRPGAGGVIGSNYAYQQDGDGNTMINFPTDLIANQLVGAEGVEFDFQQWGYVGALQKATKACFVRTDLGLSGPEDLAARSNPVFIAGSGGGGDLLWSRLMQEELGANITDVLGYQGTADSHIAIEAGEADGRCTTWSTVPASNPAWFETDPPLVTAVMQYALGGRDPMLPDTPNVEEYRDQFSDLGWNTMLAALAPLQTYRSFALPPGADPAMIATFRAAFEEMYQDSQFLAAAAAAGRPINASNGDTVERLLVTELSVTEEVRQNLIRLLDAG